MGHKILCAIWSLRQKLRKNNEQMRRLHEKKTYFLLLPPPPPIPFRNHPPPPFFQSFFPFLAFFRPRRRMRKRSPSFPPFPFSFRCPIVRKALNDDGACSRGGPFRRRNFFLLPRRPFSLFCMHSRAPPPPPWREKKEGNEREVFAPLSHGWA